MNRIAVFQADHPLQVHTTNIIRGLKSCGYQVDLFLYNCRFDFENTETVGCVYDFSEKHKYWSTHRTLRRKMLEALSYFIIEPMRKRNATLVPAKVFEESLKHVSNSGYLCFLGVEKLGLIWASSLSEVLHIPVIYYSLELYPSMQVFHLTWDLFVLLKTFRFLKLRRLEKAYHKKAKATIIQDNWRATELMKMNNVFNMDNLLLPISLFGPSIQNKSNYLRTLYNIPEEKKIVLQLGVLGKKRLVEEVTKACQTFSNDWVLIFHGPIYDERIVAKIKQLDNLKRVIISKEIIPSNKLDQLICSADIGLCFYPQKNINDYLTGFSSEKLVRYLRCGIPVVTFDYPTFLDSVGKNNCGVCICDLSSLTEAIYKIFDDYEGYRKRAYETFNKDFEFNKNFEKVIAYISQFNTNSE